MLQRLNPRLLRRLARAVCLLWLLSLAVTLVQACALPGLAGPQGEDAATLALVDAVSASASASGPAHEHDAAAELCQSYCEDTRNTAVQAKPWTDLLDAAMPVGIPGALPALEVAGPILVRIPHDPAPPEPAVRIRFLRLTI